jgi:hypothetical protein
MTPSGSSSSGTGAGSGSSSCDVLTLFTMTCGSNAACHGGVGAAGGFDLSGVTPYTSLVGEESPEGGNAFDIIDPGGDLMKSSLWLKLQPLAMIPPPLTDTQMPSGLGMLPATTITCVGEWIMAEAAMVDAGTGAAMNSSSSSSSSGAGTGVGSSGSSGAGTGVGSSGSSGAGTGVGSSGSSGAGSGSSGAAMGGMDAGVPTFTSLYTTIFGSKTCLPCHSTGGGVTTAGLNMSTKTMAYTDLVGVAAGAGGMCAGKGTRVVAGSAATSLLIEKLGATPPCGAQMPKGGTPLTAAQIAEITAWINAGATND